ncbi:hypothetical protein B0H10DRAFT_2001650 [Mycena sp. CBHHK59/15]|nr:hypothetical protein B0H10DRAFT_2001650 [Mycena sp. CBHHK59/15]
MDSLKRVVKVEKTTPESLNLRRIFGPGSCGEIRALHASGFIEFVDASSAERAVSLKLEIPGVRVLDVLTQPRLVDQYRVVNPSAFIGATDMQSNASNGRPSGVRNNLGGIHRFPLCNPNICRTDNILPTPGSCSSPFPETASGIFLKVLRSSNAPISNFSGGLKLDADTYPISSAVPVSSASALAPSLTSPSSDLVPAISSAASPPAVNPFPCMENRILTRLFGENVTLDLQSLAANPATVIELLKLTASERGNWILVGAYYRRTGNPHGAKEVVTAMLEVMEQFNIPRDDLKPAFLLLSGCEADLGKMARAKGADPGQVMEHYNNAQKWLQKVYGVDVPLPTDSLNNPGIDSSRQNDPPKAVTPSRAATSLRSRIDTSAPSAPRPYMPVSPHHRILEREVQSLRDRQAHQANILSEVRSSKRKLEECIEMERDVRRRLERELDDVIKERDKARRMENMVLDQMKREVDSRRRAEERADEERELRRRAESSAEFAMFHRSPYIGMPRISPMAGPVDQRSPELFAAFDSYPHRIAF